MKQNTIKFIYSIIGISILMFYPQQVGAGDHRNRLSIIALENPAGWAAPYNPGEMIAEMLKLSLLRQKSFHLILPPQTPWIKHKKSSGNKIPSQETQLNHPFQFILKGKVLHFTSGKPPSRTQIILNIGDALKQRAEVEIELELINHHLGTSVEKRIFRVDSIAGTVPFDLDASKVDFDSPKFLNSSIGKALSNLNHQINGFMRTTLYPLPLEAEVISVNSENDEVIINAGKIDGIDFGDLFNVYSVTLKYKDPFTQMDLGNKFARRGVIRVKDVQEGFSIAAVIAGKGFTMGELARSRKTNPVILDRDFSDQNARRHFGESMENLSVKE